MGDKREKAGKEVARIVCGLAEAGWKNRVEGTRRGGEKAGEVVARGVWCETGMPAVALEDVYSDVEQQHQQAQEQQQAQQQQQQSTFRGPRPLPSTHDSFVHPQQVFPTSACPPSNDHPTQQLSSSTQSLLPPSSPNQPFASSSQPVSPTSSAPPSPRELPTRQLESSPEPQPQRILSRKPSTSSLVSHQSTFSSRPPARPPTDLEPPRPTFAQFEPPPSPSAILKSLETQRVPSPQPVRIVAAGRRRGDSDDRSTTRNFSSDEEAMRGEERKGAWREEADPRRSVAREGPEQMGRRYNGKEGVKRNESTASERSFVARMRERYVEEQERERQEGKKTVERRPELPVRLSLLVYCMSADQRSNRLPSLDPIHGSQTSLSATPPLPPRTTPLRTNPSLPPPPLAFLAQATATPTPCNLSKTPTRRASTSSANAEPERAPGLNRATLQRRTALPLLPVDRRTIPDAIRTIRGRTRVHLSIPHRSTLGRTVRRRGRRRRIRIVVGARSAPRASTRRGGRRGRRRRGGRRS